MAFPMIKFKATNVNLDEALQDLVEQKFKTLEKLIGDETDVKCEVEFEKIVSHHTGMIYRIEANFIVGGKVFRAESTKESFEEAIDEVRGELDREVVRSNEKKETLFKRGGRKLKDMLRFGGK